jgi:hypothetical protein
VKAIDAARAQVAAAVTVACVFGAAWDAFEVTRLVARAQGERATGGFAMWTLVLSPACDGRDALGLAPSTPEGPGLPIDLGDLDEFTGDQAAGMLADLAADVTGKLRTITPQLTSPGDTAACVRALQTGEEIRGLLSEDH